MNALTSIPQSQLLSIIPNGWEDALAVAWSHEVKASAPTRFRAMHTEILRRRIAEICRQECHADYIAGKVGMNPRSIEHHLRIMVEQGALEKSKLAQRYYYRAVSA